MGAPIPHGSKVFITRLHPGAATVTAKPHKLLLGNAALSLWRAQGEAADDAEIEKGLDNRTMLEHVRRSTRVPSRHVLRQRVVVPLGRELAMQHLRKRRPVHTDMSDLGQFQRRALVGHGRGCGARRAHIPAQALLLEPRCRGDLRNLRGHRRRNEVPRLQPNQRLGEIRHQRKSLSRVPKRAERPATGGRARDHGEGFPPQPKASRTWDDRSRPGASPRPRGR
jgi:hypothetical protein